MTSGECFEKKWFYMKYIGKYFNAERLLTYMYYRNCELLAKITINLCCQKRRDLCGCNSVLVGFNFSLHHQMSITIVRSRCTRGPPWLC